MKKILIMLLVLFLSYQTSSSQWVQVSNGMGNLFVLGLGVSGNNIFAGTASGGVYKSTNYGSNWIQTPLNNQAVYTITSAGGYIFAGTNGNGVYVSTDDGASWTQTSLNNRYVVALEIIGGNIFACTNSFGVYISANNGVSWTQTALNNRDVYAITSHGGILFAGTGLNYGVYVSADNGTSWTQTSLNNRDVRSFAVIGNNIFAGTIAEGIYLSTNDGTSWTQTVLNNLNGLSMKSSGGNLFVGTPLAGFYESTNNGANWIQRVEGLSNQQVYTICILNNYMFAGTNGSSVWRRDLSEVSGIEPVSNEIPGEFSLSQNYPNPFNPVTNIHFSIPKAGNVKLVVYDALGREMVTLVNGQYSAGTYNVDMDGSNLPSGVYFYRMDVRQAGSSAENYSEIKRMVLIK